jgi:hypothetical protein
LHCPLVLSPGFCVSFGMISDSFLSDGLNPLCLNHCIDDRQDNRGCAFRGLEISHGIAHPPFLAGKIFGDALLPVELV